MYKKLLQILLVFSVVIGLAFNPHYVEANVDGVVGEQEYNLYVTLGTLPTLYAGLKAFEDETESYMWYGRKQTIDSKYLPQHVQTIALEESYGPAMLNIIIAKITELYENNSNAKFNLGQVRNCV